MESTRQQFDSIFHLYGGIALTVAVLVFGVTFYVVFRYRVREGENRVPSRRTESNRIEAGYVAIVAIVVAVILPLSLLAEKRVDSTNDADAVRVDVTAFRWGWRFQYPGERVQVIGEAGTNPTLTVPAGKRIAFSLHSRDIIHAFWVPEQRFKRDAIPGRINRFDLLFDETGVEQGTCAEFCGLHHTDMRFSVRVLDETGFNQWLGANREAPGPGGSGVPGGGDGAAGISTVSGDGVVPGDRPGKAGS